VPQIHQAVGTLPSQRQLFDIPAEVTYLNCANLSPQLRAVSAAGGDGLRKRAAPWSLTAPDWFSGAERLRELFARIVNADPDGVALVPSVSYGIAIAAANVTVARGQSIVLLDREFPSNVYAWWGLAARTGARIRTVPRPSDGSWTEALLEAIGGDTAVVALPNCHWTDGSLVELVRVGEAARAVGAALVVDASQSLGAYPIDLAAVRPDFLVTVGYKWLLGPYGLGYLYVAPAWRERGVPIEQSWLTRAGSEDFASLVDYRDAYRDGARRFDMGEFPQFISTPMAIAALEQILAWGVDRIQASLSLLTSQAALGAAELGVVTPPRAHRVGHMIGLRLAGGWPEGLGSALTAAKVYVSLRSDSIRVAPHLCNDSADLDRFLGILRRCRGASG